MNVQIKTAFGKMFFDMTQDSALALINQATIYANGDNNNVAAPVGKAAEPARPRTDDPIKKDAPRSRAETMFGDRNKWDMPAVGKGNAERPDGQEAYKGFLYIRCEECGEVKGFNAKFPQTYFQCNCGHRTELRNLRTAHVNCKCGRSFTYKTNLEYDFTIPCLSCGSPVDLELGAKKTAFVTIGQPSSGGVQRYGKPVLPRKPYYL